MKESESLRHLRHPSENHFVTLLTVTTMTMQPLIATLRMEEEATTFEGRTVFGGIWFPLARVELLPSYT
jgi:hypothetical protein